MTETLINNSNKIIFYMFYKKHTTIKEISSALKINSKYILDILKNYSRYNYSNVKVDIDYGQPLEFLNETTLIEDVKWYIKSGDINEESKFTIYFDDDELKIFKFIESIIEQNRYKFTDNIHLKEIADSIINRNKIIVTYQNQKKDIIKNKVSPVSLVKNIENSLDYLIIYTDKNDFYPYRIDRIKTVEISEDKFEYPNQKEIEDYLNSAWNMEFGEEEEFEVEFYDINNCHERVFGKLMDIGKLEMKNNILVFKGKVRSPRYFNKWLRGFGSWAKIIKPQWAIKDIKEQAKTFIERNT